MRQGKIDKERESVCERVKDRYVRVERERTGFENEWRGGGINGECCGEEEIQE